MFDLYEFGLMDKEKLCSKRKYKFIRKEIDKK